MFGEDFNSGLNLLQDEDEDVVLEGSELHQALTDMGYTNFASTPTVKVDYVSLGTNSSTIKSHQSVRQYFSDKLNLAYRYTGQDDKLKEEQLRIILESNILLDDHAATINDFFNGEQSSQKFFEWLPLVGSTIAVSFYTLMLKKRSTTAVATALAMLGFSLYAKYRHWISVRCLKHFVMLQSELHNLIKQSLKILRRTYGKKTIISEVHEKQELLGSEKSGITVSMKQTMVEVLENLSHIYYRNASEILNILPDSLHRYCIITKIEKDDEHATDNKSYDSIKNSYYTLILVQSEMMLIIAYALNGRTQNSFFRVPKRKLSRIINNLTDQLASCHSKLSKIIRTYQSCEIQPIQRVFRGVPTSKWQDTYVHLDLTSQRIQSAYKEVASILESIDLHSENDEDNPHLMGTITERMNEAYKQIETARSFAEFSSLLIAKAQRKPIDDSKREAGNESLFPVNGGDKTVVIIDRDPEIEDEVFEEYIKEEYLKPLYENSDESVAQNFRLDKLLEKNFMSELKEALIEKQKSMSERELKALGRMYDKISRDSGISVTEPEKPTDNKDSSRLARPLSIRPTAPPAVLKNRIIAETDDDQPAAEQQRKVARGPVPLPRVKTFQPDDDDDEPPSVRRFGLSQAGTPSFRFPPAFRVPAADDEDTFLGSGENSDEELLQAAVGSDSGNDDSTDH